MEFNKQAWILAVIEKLQGHGSWTGKTHVQKALFLLKACAETKPPLEFVLYRHGPYSFDLEAELEEMRSYEAIVVEPSPPYGVTIKPGNMASFVKQMAPLGEGDREAIGKVAVFVGSKNVAALERLATAAWIRTEEGIQDSDDVAARLNALKPHISLPDAKAADKELIHFLSS